MDDATKQEVIDLIDDEIKSNFSRKIGDTPTDAYQLTPKKYVDTAISSVYVAVSSIVGVISSISSGQTTKLTAGENLATGDALYVINYSSSNTQFDALLDTQVINQTSLVQAFTISANNDRLLLAGIATNTGQVVTAVSQGATPMSSLFSNNPADGTNRYSLFYLLNPSTGTNNINITTNTNTNIALQVYSYYNVSQQFPEVTASALATNGATATATLTPSTTRSFAFMLATTRGQGAPGGTAWTFNKDTTFFNTGNSAETTPIQAITGTRVADNSGNPSMAWLFSWPPTQSSLVQKVYKTSALQSVTSANFLGFTNSATNTSSLVSITYGGIYTGISSINTGANYYLSDTYGAIQSVAGTLTRKVGLGLGDAGLNITNIW